MNARLWIFTEVHVACVCQGNGIRREANVIEKALCLCGKHLYDMREIFVDPVAAANTSFRLVGRLEVYALPLR